MSMRYVSITDAGIDTAGTVRTTERRQAAYVPVSTRQPTRLTSDNLQLSSKLTDLNFLVDHVQITLTLELVIRSASYQPSLCGM
jgi:hypothetical protein